MRRQLSILMFLVVVAGLILSACGGGDGDDDPTGVVKDLFKAIEDKKLDKIADYACAAQKEEVRETFDFGAAMAEQLGGADADADQILEMLTFKVSDLKVTEKSKSGDKAVVSVTGRLEMTVDPEKFKDLVRDMLKEQGMGDVSDELIDQFAGPALEQFEDFSTDLDEELEVVKEGGKWLICGD